LKANFASGSSHFSFQAVISRQSQLGFGRVNLHRRTSMESDAVRAATLMKRRKLILKAKVESNLSYFSFKRLGPGAFNVGLIGSTCTALP
jgi:hypothetical protein